MRIIAVSFIFFARQLTVVGIVKGAAADGEPLTSLHHTQQQQHVSAHCVLRVMLTYIVHVAAWG